MNEMNMELVPTEYKLPYLAFKEGRLNDFPYGSHQPVLIHLLNTITEGDVMEFGMGDASTGLMHTLCSLQGRKLLSVETNPEWMERYIHLQTPDHEMLLINPDNIVEAHHDFFDRHYSIAFIDGAPAAARLVFLKHIKADFIVIHDTECVVGGYVNVFNYDFSAFKHVSHFTKAMPMTSLLFNTDNINEKIYDVFW